ncbi:hypothetical protein AAZX31_02G191000 [Glycine max]|uniref:Uncharacterized protein n=3 Tax=Glycine subgen. Soja TaxID=1462606 RepID=I1JGQ6_SOYBN|nr:uncharacterized protein LOC100786273 [Glycine max]XP_028211905.1 uncharacterized protein LOC114394508 [Glycine soja]KAG5063892.1 hypothetical protein JHK85_005075 [Glycine max]KAH1061307.1 hypothetical protein GYH30_004681 [Glycine max]KHN42832.1 hypothetical protein glysoja_037006 [Glycine soja]KRH72317.1 hypothetical protein GLYMA_02G204900v4 [Glycine max]RZC25931.1 hypothetical protein D0Y65_004564 [Glycine soja]|eukprot:XP_003519153.1 uncharacterized protein LOC100786273 [Glycine max]
MKKMKGVVPMEPPYEVYQDQRARLRHQSLLQDYEDLHKETEAMRRKLQATKQKKFMLEDEVRFLRQRYNYLLKHPILKPQPKQQVVKPQKLKIQAPIISKGKNYNKKEPNLRPHHPASHLNSNGRISNVADVPLKKTGHLFDLNLNARSSSKKDASINISGPPVLNLNHKERINSSKEATKKSVTPFFDLNQISREEEELQGNSEPMGIEEPKRSSQRVATDEQHGDIKLSAACRSVGDGSNRAGKRKISWQDQVALRV